MEFWCGIGRRHLSPFIGPAPALLWLLARVADFFFRISIIAIALAAVHLCSRIAFYLKIELMPLDPVLTVGFGVTHV